MLSGLGGCTTEKLKLLVMLHLMSQYLIEMVRRNSVPSGFLVVTHVNAGALALNISSRSTSRPLARRLSAAAVEDEQANPCHLPRRLSSQ